MMIRTTLFALFLASAAAAQETPPPTPAIPAPVAEAPRPVGPRVTLQTGAGKITIELDKAAAPITSANFLSYVDQKRFDGTSFYRAMKIPADTPFGLIQAGVRGRSDKVLPPIAHEPTSKTGLSHIDGAVSMARGAVGSAQGDFFIIVGNLSSLDASAKDPGYAVFGHVVEGMDVVLKIINSPTSPTAGEGAMKGQMIAAPLPIMAAKRAK